MVAPRRRLRGPLALFVDLATETGWVAAGGQTAVTLGLREPITVWDGWTSRGPVRVLHVAADDPPGLEAAIRERRRTVPLTPEPTA